MVTTGGLFLPERALVIMPHADDIEFGCAGTVATWTAQGTQVTYVIVTDNSSGSNEPGVLRRDLTATRKREQCEAAAMVGVEDVRFLGYHDGHVTPTLDLRRDLTRIIRDVRPQIVITMDPTMVISNRRNYINHPDHRAVAEAALYAVFPSAGSRPIFAELLVEGYEAHSVDLLMMTLTNEPTHKVDISSAIEKKQAALRAHASQLQQRHIDMVTGWNAADAEGEDYDYAEVFRVVDFRRPPPENAE